MASGYKTFRNWDTIDCEEYVCQKDSDRNIDDPGLNQDDAREKEEEDFDDSDDFHKHDDAEEEQNENASEAGKNNGYINM